MKRLLKNIFCFFFIIFFALSLPISCVSLFEKKSDLIAVIMPYRENLYFKAEADAADARAKALGYDTLVLFHGYDIPTIEKYFDIAISQNARAIIFNYIRILDRDGKDLTIGYIQKVKDIGIPIFIIDVDNYPSGFAVSQITSSNYQGGMLAGEEFARLMGKSGNYAELLGKETDYSSGQIRSIGFHEVVDSYSDMKLTVCDSAMWEKERAYKKMTAIIQSHLDIKGVFCNNDEMALGAVQALKEAERDDVIVVGFDGSNDAIDSIKAGVLKATVLLPAARIAEMAVEQADKYIKSGSTGLPERQSVDCILITPANVDKFRNFGRVN